MILWNGRVTYNWTSFISKEF